VDKAAIERDLLQMEHDWLAATTNRDVATVSRIEADDIIMTYPDGTTGTKVDELKTVQDGDITADSWEIAESKVNVLDANAAVVTGRQVIKNGKVKDPKGKTLDISGEYRFTDVFARRDGKWQAVASELTQIASPPKSTPTPIASPVVKPSPAPAGSPAPAPSPRPTRRPLPPIKVLPPRPKPSPVTKPTP
jgi:ketosteroid isomerase-like protein